MSYLTSAGRSVLPLRQILLIQTRTATDIEYYRRVDQSHLHLVKAQSSMRRFQLKLKAMEADKEDANVGEAKRKAEQLEVKEEKKGGGSSGISEYIERGPSDILRAIAEGIPRDVTAPLYQFHDDPYLIPYTGNDKRLYLESKEGGRRAARYIIERHPELFENNQIEMHPPIKAFMPRTRIFRKKATEELLRVFIEGFNVEDAVQCYSVLKEEGAEVSAETKQALLELVAYTNEEEAMEENAAETQMMNVKRGERWKREGLAEELVLELDTTEARVAHVMGMLKHADYQLGREAFEKLRKENGSAMSLKLYNQGLKALNVRSTEELEKEVKSILTEMRDKKIKPDAVTLKNILGSAMSVSGREFQNASRFALESVQEFRLLGVEPSLACYRFLLLIFCRQNFIKKNAVQAILDELQARDVDRMALDVDNDLGFFVQAMKEIDRMDDVGMAYQLHDIYTKITSMQMAFSKENFYYTTLLNILLKNESLDAFMALYSDVVPHLANPMLEQYLDILGAIEKNGPHWNHFTRVWSDLTISRFAKAGKYPRNKCLAEVLRVAAQADLENDEGARANTQVFRSIARTGLDEAQAVESRGYEMSKDQSLASVANGVLGLALRLGDLKLAAEALDFMLENVSTVPGSLTEDAVGALLAACLAEDDVTAATQIAMKCVEYGCASVFSTAFDMAKTVSTEFDLDELQKKKLDTLFAHESSWETVAGGQ